MTFNISSVCLLRRNPVMPCVFQIWAFIYCYKQHYTVSTIFKSHRSQICLILYVVIQNTQMWFKCRLSTLIQRLEQIQVAITKKIVIYTIFTQSKVTGQTKMDFFFLRIKEMSACSLEQMGMSKWCGPSLEMSFPRTLLQSPYLLLIWGLSAFSIVFSNWNFCFLGLQIAIK